MKCGKCGYEYDLENSDYTPIDGESEEITLKALQEYHIAASPACAESKQSVKKSIRGSTVNFFCSICFQKVTYSATIITKGEISYTSYNQYETNCICSQSIPKTFNERPGQELLNLNEFKAKLLLAHPNLTEQDLDDI